jgi:hypothetical protein
MFGALLNRAPEVLQKVEEYRAISAERIRIPER